MNRPLPADFPAHKTPSAAQLSQLGGRPQRAKPLLRKLEVAYLAANGEEMHVTRIAPAVPTFEMPVMAFARGTLFSTTQGQVAVEDIYPGIELLTVDHAAQPVMWKGETRFVPNQPGQSHAATHLSRISTDALGFGRPNQDLMLSYGARLFRQDRGRGHFKRATEVLDGVNAVEIRPISAMSVYHLALPTHSRIIANGVEVESYHPGSLRALGARADLKALFLSLFPHVTAISDFGPLNYPRDLADDFVSDARVV